MCSLYRPSDRAPSPRSLGSGPLTTLTRPVNDSVATSRRAFESISYLQRGLRVHQRTVASFCRLTGVGRSLPDAAGSVRSVAGSRLDQQRPLAADTASRSASRLSKCEITQGVFVAEHFRAIALQTINPIANHGAVHGIKLEFGSSAIYE